jgi:hypothetical protein
LRAAAALEAGDLAELETLLPALRRAEPSWTVPLQVASAMGDQSTARREELVADARAKGAPAWALAWTRACAPDPQESLRGTVDLLFTDASLARTVAARDTRLPGAADDREAVERYASFAHGRDAVRRFGAVAVAAVLAHVGKGQGDTRT